MAVFETSRKRIFGWYCRDYSSEILLKKLNDMKFEFELLRALLIYVEEHAREPWSHLTEIDLEGWSKSEVTYHVIIAREAGLIHAWSYEIPDAADRTKLIVTFSIQRLTFNGHELLGAIRDPKRWQIIHDYIKSAGISTISAVRAHIDARTQVEMNRRFGLDVS